MRIEVREVVEALEATEDVEELEERRPPRVKDFSRSCWVLVVATSGLGSGDGCTVSRRNMFGLGGTFGGVRLVAEPALLRDELDACLPVPAACRGMPEVLLPAADLGEAAGSSLVNVPCRTMAGFSADEIGDCVREVRPESLVLEVGLPPELRLRGLPELFRERGDVFGLVFVLPSFLA